MSAPTDSAVPHDVVLTTDHPRAQCVDLPATFPGRFCFAWDESYEAERPEFRAIEAPWLATIPGRSGRIFPWGGRRLAAYSKARTARRALESLDGVTVAQGGTPCPEVIVIFDVSLIDVVAAIVGSKRPRKRLTPEQRAALVERGRGFRFPSTKDGANARQGMPDSTNGSAGLQRLEPAETDVRADETAGVCAEPEPGTMTTVVEALLMTVSEMELMTAPAMAPNDHPFDRVVAALRARGMTILPQRDGNIRATCPAHPDQKPSLIVTRRDDKVLMHCFAGCRKGAPAQALGLRPADLFTGARTTQRRAEVESVYDYRDRDGVLVAQKVRSERKEFWWRHPDPAARGGFRLGLEGRVPGLYRLPELMGAQVVYVVEGEKAVDRLRSLGLVATCGPAGASSWKRESSFELLSAGCRELVILADHDQAGERHAERVAVDITAVESDGSIAVKVVHLPGLAPSGDVVDFLEAGHDLDDLLAVVAQTPAWSPGLRERQRTEMLREQAKIRMRKHRAKTPAVDVPATKVAARSDADVLSAVEATLDAVGEPCSWRRISTLVMADGHPRRAIKRALTLGVDTDVLVMEGGDRRGRAMLYSRVSNIDRVTKPAHSADIYDVTKAAHSKSAPQDRAAGQSVAAAFLEPIRVGQCAVTSFAVTPGERSSYTLQEKKDLPRHTPVTGSGALGVKGDESVCCGKHGAEFKGGAIKPWCKLCQKSPTYLADLLAPREAVAR